MLKKCPVISCPNHVVQTSKSWLRKKQEAAYNVNGCPFIQTNHPQNIKKKLSLIPSNSPRAWQDKVDHLEGCDTILASVTVYKKPWFTVCTSSKYHLSEYVQHTSTEKRQRNSLNPSLQYSDILNLTSFANTV